MSCLHSSEGENRQREAGSQSHHRPVGRYQDPGRNTANALSHMSTETEGMGVGQTWEEGARKRDGGGVQVGSKGRCLGLTSCQ